MSISPVIVAVRKPWGWEGRPKFVDPYLKDNEEPHCSDGMVRQMVVFCPVRNQHYVISENTGLQECLVFRSDAKGNVENMNEVGGSRCITMEEVFQDFDQWMFDV